MNAYLNAIDGLPDVHQRLRQVVILCDDAIKIIKQQDGPNTLFYYDPPYLHETRTATKCYAHEMTVDDHRRLLDTLAGIEGKFVLSGYPNEMYDARGWRTEDFSIDNKASSKKTKDKKTERIWMNF